MCVIIADKTTKKPNLITQIAKPCRENPVSLEYRLRSENRRHSLPLQSEIADPIRTNPRSIRRRVECDNFASDIDNRASKWFPRVSAKVVEGGSPQIRSAAGPIYRFLFCALFPPVARGSRTIRGNGREEKTRGPWMGRTNVVGEGENERVIRKKLHRGFFNTL